MTVLNDGSRSPARGRHSSPAVTFTSSAPPKRGDAAQVWCPSIAFIIPDTLQPCYRTKPVGYVEHRLHAGGRHESRLVRVSGAADLSSADLPGFH